MHDKPILLDVVPISFAVLLRLHRFRPRSRVSAVLGRRINDTIAGSVHRLRFQPLQYVPLPAGRCFTAFQPSSYAAPHIDSIRMPARRSACRTKPCFIPSLQHLDMALPHFSARATDEYTEHTHRPRVLVQSADLPEGKRMASGHTGNVVPRKGLRVRVPCPPPLTRAVAVSRWRPFLCAPCILAPPIIVLDMC